MQKLQTTIFYSILASEAGHVFCCVIPTVLSLLALAASYGIIITVPGFVFSIHKYMHEWEQLVIILSGLLLVFGWALFMLNKRIESRHDCCSKSKCETKTNKAQIVMVIASALFIVNVTAYTFLHGSMNADFTINTHQHENHLTVTTAN